MAKVIFPRNSLLWQICISMQKNHRYLNRRKVPPVVLLLPMHYSFLVIRMCGVGTSLTKGVDCSGFVMQVYAHYGISLPHSSSALRGVGRGVSYSEAQPGDIICYSGHVAIYLGGGKIVHASNPKRWYQSIYCDL